MIIIPDIHGRSFWKDVVKGHEDEEIIFLGDYLDPYPDEWEANTEERIKAMRENAIYNFKDILEFKRAHMKNVILLLGNHDCEYYYDTYVCDCRRDVDNYWDIRDLFRDNMNMFQIAYDKTVNGKHFLFTHGGLRKPWADQFIKHYTMDNIVDLINNQHFLYSENVIKNEEAPGVGSFRYALGCCSFYRGGWDNYSSPVWGDIRESYAARDEFPEVFQIFAHTRILGDAPLVCDNFAMLDVRRGFILNDDGIITYMDGTAVGNNLG